MQVKIDAVQFEENTICCNDGTSAGTSKNPVGYRVLVSAAMSSYSNLQYGYGQAKPLCLPSMHYVGSGGPSHTRVKLGGG